MEGFSVNDFQQWMDSYGRACIDKDPEAFGALFAKEARYYKTPFEKPLRGPPAISRYLRETAALTVDVRFSYHILSVIGCVVIALWQGGFTEVRSGKRVKLDGVFLVELNEQHKCRVFREWWHRFEETVEQPSTRILRNV